MRKTRLVKGLFHLEKIPAVVCQLQIYNAHLAKRLSGWRQRQDYLSSRLWSTGLKKVVKLRSSKVLVLLMPHDFSRSSHLNTLEGLHFVSGP